MIPSNLKVLYKEIKEWEVPIPMKNMMIEIPKKSTFFQKKYNIDEKAINQKFISIKYNEQKVIFVFELCVLIYNYCVKSHQFQTQQKIEFDEIIDFIITNEDFSILIAFSYDEIKPSKLKMKIFIYNSLENSFENYVGINNLCSLSGLVLTKNVLIMIKSDNLISFFDFSKSKEIKDYKFAKKNNYIVNSINNNKKKNEFFIILYNEKKLNYRKKYQIIFFEYNEEYYCEEKQNLKLLTKENEELINAECSSESFLIVLFLKEIQIFKKSNNQYSIIYTIDQELIKNENIDRILSYNSRGFLILSAHNLILYEMNLNNFEEKPENSILKKEEYEIPAFQAIFYNNKFKNNIIIIYQTKNELKNKLKFQALEILLLGPKEAFIEYLKLKNYERSDLIIKEYNFDTNFIYKTKWEYSEHEENDLKEFLFKINDVNYLEEQYEYINKINEENLLLLYDKCIELREKNIMNKNNLIENIIKSYFIYYKKKMFNIYIKLNKNFYFDYREFLQFSKKNIIFYFMEMVENSKFLTIKFILEEFYELIFENYWFIFQNLIYFYKEPLKYNFLYPKLLKENDDFEISLSNQYKINIFSYYLKKKNENEIQSFNNLMIKYKDIDLDKNLFEKYISTNLKNDFKTLLELRKFDEDLNSEKTYQILIELMYKTTLNIDNCINILKIGYENGFKKLNKILLSFYLYGILLYETEKFDINLYDFKKMKTSLKFQLIIEENLKEYKFIKLLKVSIFSYYNEYLNKAKFQKHLTYFINHNKCTPKLFFEIIKMLFIENKYLNNEEEFIENNVFKFIENRLYFEHYEYISEIIKLIKINKKNDYYNQLSEISQILYAFNLNYETNYLLKFYCKTKENNMQLEAIKLLNEILENYLQNRKRLNNLVLNGDLITLDNIKYIIKIIFYLREKLCSEITESQIYQILSKKLLENSKFSILKELIEKEKIFKKFNEEIFELIVSESIEKTYNTVSSINQIEGYINKSLEFLKPTSQVKISEQNLLKACLTLEKFKISYNLKEIRNSNRLFLLNLILNELQDKDLKEFPSIDFYKQLSKADGNESDNKCFMEFLKNFGLKLLKLKELGKVEELISELNDKESSFLYELSYELIKNYGKSLNFNDFKHYLKLAFYYCDKFDDLREILKQFDKEKDNKMFFIDKIICSDLSLIDKKSQFFTNDKLLIKSLNSIFKNLYGINEYYTNLEFFFLDLTINPQRAFFQLSISETLDFEYFFDELIQILYKSNIFDNEILIESFLKTIIFQELNHFNCEYFNFSNHIDNSIIKKLKDSVQKKKISIIEKYYQILQIQKNIDFFNKFLLNLNDKNKFIFDVTFRNQTISTILMESGDLKTYDIISNIIDLTQIKPIDLLIMKLISNINQKNIVESDSNILKLKNFLDDSNKIFDYINKIFNRINGNIDIIGFFFDDFLDSLIKYFSNIKNQINNSNLIFLRSFCQNFNNSSIYIKNYLIDLNFILPNIQIIKEVDKNNNLKDCLKNIYKVLDQSNILIISKYLSRFLKNPEIEEKIYGKFALELLKQDLLIKNYENDNNSQIFTEILIRIKKTKILSNFLFYIEEKENCFDVDFYEILKKYLIIFIEYIDKIKSDNLLIKKSNKIISILNLKIKYMKNQEKTENIFFKSIGNNFKRERIGNDQTIFSILDYILLNFDQLIDNDLTNIILHNLNIDLFYSFLNYYFKKIVFELNQIHKISNFFNSFKNSLNYKNELNIVKLKNTYSDINKYENLLKNLFKLLEDDKYSAIKFFDSNFFINICLETSLEVQLVLLKLMISTLKTKNLERINTLKMFEINCLTKILINLDFSSEIREILEFKEIYSNEFILELIIDDLINFSNSSDENIYILNLIGLMNGENKIFKLTEKVFKFLFLHYPFNLLELINLGLFDEFIEKYFKFLIDELISNYDRLICYLLKLYCLKKLDTEEDESSILIKNQTFYRLLLEEFKNITNKRMLEKYIISYNLNEIFIESDIYQQILQTLSKLPKIISININIPLDDQNELFEIKSFKRPCELKNIKELDDNIDKCWFGKSVFEIYIQNIITLINSNQYYDAGKLNYLLHNYDQVNYSIKLILDKLKIFLNQIDNDEYLKSFLNGENQFLLKISIEKLNKINE